MCSDVGPTVRWLAPALPYGGCLVPSGWVAAGLWLCYVLFC